MSLNKFMHPRNPYKLQKPDFKLLAGKYPEFREHVIQDKSGKTFLNFKDPESLRVLTKVLLKEDFDLEVDLPRDRLVPTVPLRLNYLLWVEDIIGRGRTGVKGIDIGTGASCIYPLLGYKTSKWSFLATDVDAQNIFYAKKNVAKNKLEAVITVKKVTDDALLTGALLDTDPATTYDFSVCNPPFFADHLEAQAVSTSRNVDRADPSSVSTASPKESIAVGGEVAFVKLLIADSLSLRDRVRVYTTMVGKKTSLPPLKEELRKLQVEKFATTEFCQGKTMRWGIAWTFDNTVVFPKSNFQSAKNEKPPLSYRIPFGAGGSIYDIPSLTRHLKVLLDELKIQYKEKKCLTAFSSLATVAFENTWSNQRRKRRQQMRENSDPGTGVGNPEVQSMKGSGSESDKGDNYVSNKAGSSETKKGDVSETIKGENSGSKKVDISDMNKRDDSESKKGDISDTNMGDNSESKKRDVSETDKGDTGTLGGDKMDTPTETTPATEGSSTNRKRELLEQESEETSQTKRTKSDNSEKETTVSAGGEKRTKTDTRRRYILKCDINLKKPAGSGDITLDVIWRGGDNRELLHQVMQYLKNKLKSPC